MTAEVEGRTWNRSESARISRSEFEFAWGFETVVSLSERYLIGS